MRRATKSAVLMVWRSFKSAPAQNELPLASINTTCTALSCDSCWQARVSSWHINRLRALRLSGRFKVSVATWSWTLSSIMV